MAKIRVHELAKEMGIPSKQLVDTLQDMGLNIKNHMSTMEDNQVNWVRKKLVEGPSSSPSPKPGQSAGRTAQNAAPVKEGRQDSAIDKDRPAQARQTKPAETPAAESRNNVGRPAPQHRPVDRPAHQTGPSQPHREEQPRGSQTSAGQQPRDQQFRGQPPRGNQTAGGQPYRGNQPYNNQQPRGDGQQRSQPPRDNQQNRDQQFRGQPPQNRDQQPRDGQNRYGQPPRDQQRPGQPPRGQYPGPGQQAGQGRPGQYPGPGQQAGQGRPGQYPGPGQQAGQGRPGQYPGPGQQAGQGRPGQYPGPGQQTGQGRPGQGRPQNNEGRPAPQGGRGPGQSRPQPGGGGRPFAPGGRGPSTGQPRPAQPGTAQPERPRMDQKKKTAGGPKTEGQDSWANRNKNKSAPSRDFSRPGRKPKHKRRKEETVQEMPSTIMVPDSITVRELAEKLLRSPAEILKRLMDLGTLATINQELDYETTEILAGFYDVTIERELSEEAKLLEEIVDEEGSLKPRPPVVTVMGHVDHGKTSLLDRIRKADVASGEAGGITQHIGAYQVKVNDNRITFIDTPGHEAFTAMRARGANLTDIVILVVAADDGVMPQTVEAVNHIKAANVPFLVAVNKIDKPDANPERVMQQLTEFHIVSEEWGGDTIFAPVSAKTGEGIDQLLEMVLLVAEMHEIKANPERNAEGVVIEGELDKGRGAVATVLVQKGTLRVGDYVICGTNFAKVRAMTDYRGRRVEEAYPSMPVEIMGWSDVPEAGERVQVCDEKVAKEIASLRISERKIEEQKHNSRVSLDDFFKKLQTAEVKELNLIVKGDVQGSVEALTQSLLRLSTEEVKVNVIHTGVGAVSETDVMLASASNAIIIGFNVRPENKARKYAEDENIDVRLYRVIYETIDDVKKAMSGLLDPIFKEKFQGRAEVRALFKVPNAGVIAGSYVTDGKILRNSEVRVLRDGVIVYEGKLSSLRRFKDDAKEVAENYECGIGIRDFNDLKEGDIIEAFTLEEVPRQI